MKFIIISIATYFTVTLIKKSNILDDNDAVILKLVCHLKFIMSNWDGEFSKLLTSIGNDLLGTSLQWWNHWV